MVSTMNYGRTPVAAGQGGQVSPHGQASLLLTESLMHALLAKGILSREDFVEIVEGAADVEVELALAMSSSPPDGEGSLLRPLAAAFRRELGL